MTATPDSPDNTITDLDKSHIEDLCVGETYTTESKYWNIICYDKSVVLVGKFDEFIELKTIDNVISYLSN